MIVESKHNRLGQLTYFKKDTGYWVKQKFKNGHVVYYEDSEGLIEEKRFNRYGQITYHKVTQNGVIKLDQKYIN